MGDKTKKIIKDDYEKISIISPLNRYFKFFINEKELRKLIFSYYKNELKLFFYFLMASIFCMLGGLAVVKFFTFLDIIYRSYIAIILWFSFSIFIPSSVIFLQRFLINFITTFETFYFFSNTLNEINILIQTKERNIDIINHFQKGINYFDSRFSFIFSKYFKKYKKQIKSNRRMLRECYYSFDKIINMTLFNAEINSERTKELLLDFKKYLIELNNKILNQILKKNILIYDAVSFFKKWDSYFKQNYKQKYREPTKYFEEYVEEMRTKYRFRQNIFIKMFETLFSILFTILIIILIFLVSPDLANLIASIV